MPDKTMYKLTAKGQQEVDGRTSDLPATLGELLRLIDGNTAVDDLKAKFGHLDDAELQAGFERLTNDGYIEPLTAAAVEPDGPVTLDFSMSGDRSARPGASPPRSPAPVQQTPRGSGEELDFSQQLDQPTPKPSAEKIAEAEQMTVAGMRTLKAAGYYVNILSKPGVIREPRSGAKYTVLILDDDKQNALHVARALLLADFDVRSAENRDQALVELKKVPAPDAIILNPKVPKLHGLDLLARLQQHKTFASVPVVVITDDHAHETVVNALARGAAGYMTKPLKQEALLDTVRAVLGLK